MYHHHLAFDSPYNLVHSAHAGTKEILFLASSAFAGSFRVHYNVRGSGRDITVQAESSSPLIIGFVLVFDARRDERCWWVFEKWGQTLTDLPADIWPDPQKGDVT